MKKTDIKNKQKKLLSLFVKTFHQSFSYLLYTMCMQNEPLCQLFTPEFNYLVYRRPGSTITSHLMSEKQCNENAISTNCYFLLCCRLTQTQPSLPVLLFLIYQECLVTMHPPPPLPSTDKEMKCNAFTELHCELDRWVQ